MSCLRRWAGARERDGDRDADPDGAHRSLEHGEEPSAKASLTTTQATRTEFTEGTGCDHAEAGSSCSMVTRSAAPGARGAG
jgi:hypothetical protein